MSNVVCGPFVGVMRSDESVKLLNITRINFSETGVVRLDIFSALIVETFDIISDLPRSERLRMVKADVPAQHSRDSSPDKVRQNIRIYEY